MPTVPQNKAKNPYMLQAVALNGHPLDAIDDAYAVIGHKTAIPVSIGK